MTKTRHFCRSSFISILAQTILPLQAIAVCHANKALVAQGQFNFHGADMKDRILQATFSLPGASLAIGAAGFLSALVTMFVNVNEQLSVKWLLFVILIFSTFTLILLKIIYDLSSEKRPPAPFENPIKYISDEQIFVIRRNDNFLNSIVVGCYLQNEEIDRLAYVCVVHLVQDRVIQIKVVRDFGIIASGAISPELLKTFVIRPVVPVTALESYIRQEDTDE